MKSGNKVSFKNMGSSPAKQKVDPDAPGTPGKPGYEPPVKRSDLDVKGKAIWDAHRAMPKISPAKPAVRPKFKSPAKQKNFNKTGSKASTTPGYSTTKAANKGLPKNFNATGSSKAGKFAKVAKKVVGKGGKFLGGKLLGVAGMMMATSSKADQPTKGKGKREYPGGKIDFTKKK